MTADILLTREAFDAACEQIRQSPPITEDLLILSQAQYAGMSALFRVIEREAALKANPLVRAAWEAGWQARARGRFRAARREEAFQDWCFERAREEANAADWQEESADVTTKTNDAIECAGVMKTIPVTEHFLRECELDAEAKALHRPPRDKAVKVKQTK